MTKKQNIRKITNTIGGKVDAAKTVISNTQTLDPVNPIPFDYSGSAFVAENGRRYIPFLEPKDTFAQLLLEAKLMSNTTKACISSKVKYCIGKGWYLKDSQKDKALDEWAKKLNRKRETLNDITKKIIDNLFTCGNSYIEIIRGSIGNKKYVKVFVRNFLDCRVSHSDDDFPESVMISKQFRKTGYWSVEENRFVELPLYHGESDQKWFKSDSGQHVIIHLKTEESGLDHYGLPSNIASLPQQILEYKSSRYNMDNFDNNLSLGGVIVLQGNVTQEEANKLGRNIIYQHTGDGKRGRYIVMSSENGIENSKVIPFEKQKDGDFIKFDERMEQKIFLANEWDKVLIDSSGSAGMGKGDGYIRSVFEMKKTTVIEPMQEFVIEKFISPLFEICDAWMGTSFSAHEFGFKTVMPISFSGDINVNSVVKKDEARVTLGLQPVGGDIGDEFIEKEKKGGKDVSN